MLVLTRCPNETLIIGNDVKITVLNVHGNQVRIGVEAPVHALADRRETRRKAPASPIHNHN